MRSQTKGITFPFLLVAFSYCRNLTCKFSSSLAARYRIFDDRKNYESEKSQSFRKEASKLYEYVNTVERALQSCEILQAVSDNEHDEQGESSLIRRELLSYAGLVELKRVPIIFNKVKIQMSILKPIEQLLSELSTFPEGKSKFICEHFNLPEDDLLRFQKQIQDGNIDVKSGKFSRSEVSRFLVAYKSSTVI